MPCFDFPHRGEANKHPWDRIPPGRFHTTILGGLFQAAQKAGLTKVVKLRSKRLVATFPIGGEANKDPWDRNPPGRFHTTILGGLFQEAQKVGLTEVAQLRSKRLVSTFPIGVKRINTIGIEAGLTKVVQLRSKRPVSTFPIGAKRINTLGIKIHKVGFIPPFWVGFSKQRKKPR